MPDDINGNHSLTAGYKASTGQKVLASQHNPPLQDISECLTARVNRHGNSPMLANLPMGGFKITGAANGTAPTDGATFGQLQAALPIGAVIDFALPVVPAGWLLCYGQALLADTPYTELRAALVSGGFPFGQDGSGSPLLPDARGRSTAGKDNMGGTAAGRLGAVAGFNANASLLGATGGTETTALTIAQMPAHNHGGATAPAGAHNHFYETVSFGSAGNGLKADSGIAPTFPTAVTSTVGDHVHGIPLQGSGDTHSNVQPTIIFNKIIKAV